MFPAFARVSGQEIAAELETLAAELAEEASKLDRLFNVIEEA